jgi:hypothetical protein
MMLWFCEHCPQLLNWGPGDIAAMMKGVGFVTPGAPVRAARGARRSRANGQGPGGEARMDRPSGQGRGGGEDGQPPLAPQPQPALAIPPQPALAPQAILDGDSPFVDIFDPEWDGYQFPFDQGPL